MFKSYREVTLSFDGRFWRSPYGEECSFQLAQIQIDRALLRFKENRVRHTETQMLGTIVGILDFPHRFRIEWDNESKSAEFRESLIFLPVARSISLCDEISCPYAYRSGCDRYGSATNCHLNRYSFVSASQYRLAIAETDKTEVESLRSENVAWLRQDNLTQHRMMLDLPPFCKN